MAFGCILLNFVKMQVYHLLFAIYHAYSLLLYDFFWIKVSLCFNHYKEIMHFIFIIFEVFLDIWPTCMT